MISKITKTSRYYNALNELRILLSYDKLFPKGYNEDKNYTYEIYDSIDQVELSVIKISNEIENNVKEYLKANLYSKEEIKLFIENLMPSIERFGCSSIREMGMRYLDFEKKISIAEKYHLKANGDFTEEIFLKELEYYPLQIQKNIRSLINIRELLIESFNLFLKELVLQKEKEITAYHMSPKVSKANDAYKDAIWFKVGLLFATGQMDKLLKEHNNNCTAIAKALDNKNYRPFISETKSGTNKIDKNIYSNPTKVKKIYDHCLANRIPVTAAFKSHLQQE